MGASLDPDDLRGQFIVEVGARQAWPFITLCTNATALAVENRLYIDTTFTLDPGGQAFNDGDPERAVAGLLDLSNRTITDTATSAAGELVLSFDGGRVLTVSGAGAAFTTGSPWWLSNT